MNDRGFLPLDSPGFAQVSEQVVRIFDIEDRFICFGFFQHNFFCEVKIAVPDGAARGGLGLKHGAGRALSARSHHLLDPPDKRVQRYRRPRQERHKDFPHAACGSLVVGPACQEFWLALTASLACEASAWVKMRWL